MNKALAELQGQLPRITKDLIAKVKSERTGAQYTYSYADLSLISREALPLLAKCGLSFTSRPTLVDGRFVLAYELRHISGEQIDGVYPLPERGTPQEIGSAITYARRYSLCAVTGIAPDDEDHDAIVAEKAEQRRRRESRQSKADAAPKVPPMTSGQQKRMQELFKELGMEDRGTRLKYATEIVGRPLRSATEMSHDEADTVIAKAELELNEGAEWPKTAKAGGAE
jgi:hypothetical protein